MGLPGPRGGRRRTRLVPQFDVLQLSSKSGLWEAISWPIFVFEKCRIPITKTFFAKTPKDLLIGCWGYCQTPSEFRGVVTVSTTAPREFTGIRWWAWSDIGRGDMLLWNWFSFLLCSSVHTTPLGVAALNQNTNISVPAHHRPARPL